MLDNSLPSHAIIPRHRSLWPNGSSPQRGTISPGWANTKHTGSEPCTSFLLSACFPPRKKKQEPGSKVGRLLPLPPLCVSWKSLLKFAVGWGAGLAVPVHEYMSWLSLVSSFILFRFPLSIHWPYIKYMPSQTQQADYQTHWQESEMGCILSKKQFSSFSIASWIES